MTTNGRGAPGKPRKAGGGRKPKPIDQRAPVDGKVLLRLSPHAAAKLARLMLTTDAPTPEALIERMIDELIRKDDNHADH